MILLNNTLKTGLCLLLINSTVLFVRFAQAESSRITKKEHTVVGCRIYNSKGQRVWVYKARFCLFLEDGSFISSNGYNLEKHSKEFELLWSRDLKVHHQVNWNSDKTKLLVISEDYHEYKGEKIKFDTLIIADSETGATQQKYSLYEDRANIERLSPKGRGDSTIHIPELVRRTPSIKNQFSHLNSFYEIPDNESAKKDPVFSKGNFVINLNYKFMIAILDSKLERVIRVIHHSELDNDESMHDVQVLSSGELLIYYNRSFRGDHSSLVKYDPIKKIMTTLFESEPKTVFNAKVCGGIQELDNGNLLYSDVTQGAWVYEIDPSKSNKRVWSLRIDDIVDKTKQYIQQAKREDLTQFLQQNLGL
ncbi:MAG: hypothetical protein HRT45_03265 [Bdellovibrionales bacterium]|nr:hypothetical protein [Bdellovibrionales bacterium]